MSQRGTGRGRSARLRFLVGAEGAACLRSIVILLAHRNRLSLVTHLHAQRTVRCRDAEVLITEAPDEIERFLRRLLLRDPQRIRGDLRLDGSAHVRRRAEEAIRGHESLDALVRALEVVVLDVQPDAPLAIREVGEHGPAEELFPQALPEALDLPERLRVLRPAPDVRDPVPAKQMFELRRAAPRGVLPPLVRQHLARLPVLGDAALECLDDELRLLVMGHRPRHQVTRVVVEKCRHVDAVIAPELEREDVALPELVRLRAFEAALRLVTRRRRIAFDDQPLFVQDASHRRRRDAQSFESGQYIAESLRSPVGILATECDDLGTLWTALCRLPPTGYGLGGTAREARLQCIHAPALKQRYELLDRRQRHAECGRDVSVPGPAHHRLDDSDTHLQGDGAVSFRCLLFARLRLLLRHCQSPRASVSRDPRTTGAMRTSTS